MPNVSNPSTGIFRITGKGNNNFFNNIFEYGTAVVIFALYLWTFVWLAKNFHPVYGIAFMVLFGLKASLKLKSADAVEYWIAFARRSHDRSKIILDALNEVADAAKEANEDGGELDPKAVLDLLHRASNEALAIPKPTPNHGYNPAEDDKDGISN